MLYLRVKSPLSESTVHINKTSVPDSKLIISDQDPQIENQEFRIRIRILLWTSDGEKKFSILVNNKTQMGW